MPDPIIVIAGALALVAVLWLVWRTYRRSRSPDSDLFRALGTDPKAAMARVAAPPVDLSKPIKGDPAWQAIRAHAGDAAYQRAVETLRVRYQIVSNPMLLSNTLQTTMHQAGLSFREAAIRVAQDDGLKGHR